MINPNGRWRRTRALERAVTPASQLHEASVPVAQRRALSENYKMIFVFKKKDLLWWLGIITFWFFGRVIITLPEFIYKASIPLWEEYYGYLIEGVVASSLGVILIKILGNIKDEVKEINFIGIKFVWHKKYIWH